MFKKKDETVSPRIGVSTAERGGVAAWIFFWINIWLAGGIPLRITTANPRSVRELDGLVIGGGADIDPALYGEEKLSDMLEKSRDAGSRSSSAIKRLLKAGVAVLAYLLRRVMGLKEAPKDARLRDELEVSLIREALQRNIPLLGVCRGMQLINVVLGGSLHQEVADVYEDVKNVRSVLPYKVVNVKKGSLLFQALGRTDPRVNAIHHQSINKVGRSLKVVAESDSGMVQAIESMENSFVLGVQWHPEYLIQYKSQRKIFSVLINKSCN